MPEPIKIDPKDFVPASRTVTKIDPSEFTPATPAAAVPTDKGTPSTPPASASIMDPHPYRSAVQRLIRGAPGAARETAGQAGAAGTIWGGAEMGAGIGGAIGGPPGALIGGLIGGAAGAYSAPEARHLIVRGLGSSERPPTQSEAASSAYVNTLVQAGSPIVLQTPDALVEGVLGVRGAANQYREGIASGQTALETQAATAQEVKSARLAQGQKAIAENLGLIKDAQEAVDHAKAKLSKTIQSRVEKALPAETEATGQRAVETMTGKTSAQFKAEAAQPYEQRAAALSQATEPYFDASAKFHQEVGQKFEPYIGPVKNTAIPQATAESLNGTVAQVEKTLTERGQRIESAELNRIFDDLKLKEAEVEDPFARGQKVKVGKEQKITVGGKALDPSNPAEAKLIAQMKEKGLAGGEEEPPTTFGQLWGLRARANKVLATARNPADRLAAREIVSAITDQIPGVPAEIRSQYAFERKLMPSVLRKVSTARTPQEVGDAIFGSKTSPEPAEVPLQVIRFTKQNAPEQMDGLRQAFADHYFGNRMDANDLAKIHPQVLKELYGDNADNVIRLLGPEGDIKQRAWADLITKDPQARANFEASISDAARSQEAIQLRQTMRDGEQLLKELSADKYAKVKAAMDATKIPEQKLKIIAENLPDPRTAGVQNLREGLKAGKLEGYMGRRLVFMAGFSALGAYGNLTKRPGLVTASLVMGAMLGARGAARYALTTEGGANLYTRALDMRPTPENSVAFGRVVAPIITSALIHAQANPPEEESSTPAAGAASPRTAPAPR